jgi:trk system potassium uptake protein TrkH
MIFLTIFAVIKGGDDIEFSRRRISKDTANKALAIFGIVMFLAYSFIFLLTITDGDKDFLSLSFEVFSALGTVGLSQGITPLLSNAGKIIISLAMFLGRVGPLTIVVALSNKGDKRKFMRYPEGKISVG